MGGLINKFTPAHDLLSKDAFCIRGFGFSQHGECGVKHHPFGAQQVVLQVAAGASHSLAVLSNGSIVAWGSNLFGQLGNGRIVLDKKKDNAPNPGPCMLPVSFPSPIKIVKVAAGVSHSACITDSGLLFTWGRGQEGQLGYICDPTYKHVGTSWRCQVSPRLVEAIGSAYSYPPQPPHPSHYRSPSASAGPTPTVSSVALGNNFTVALLTDGTVWTFGEGRRFVLGTGSERSSFEPVKLELEEIVKISAGWSHVVALSSAGQVYTWGNQYSDINEAIPAIRIPVQVDLGLKAVDIAAGDYHSAVVAIDDEHQRHVFTWGGNGFGQLGYDTSEQEDPYLMPTPKLISKLSGLVSQIYCGGCSSYALTVDSKVWGWGSNHESQFGPGLPCIVREPVVIFESKEQKIMDLAVGHSRLFVMSRHSEGKRRTETTENELEEFNPTSRELLSSHRTNSEQGLIARG
jgi:alpha-tubulin suppressor-like RCC1 family protein